MRQNKQSRNKMKPINITDAVDTFVTMGYVVKHCNKGWITEEEFIWKAAELTHNVQTEQLTAALYSVQGKAKEYTLSTMDICIACAKANDQAKMPHSITIIGFRGRMTKQNARYIRVTQVQVARMRGKWWITDIRRVVFEVDKIPGGVWRKCAYRVIDAA